jgi:hypothetical protein
VADPLRVKWQTKAFNKEKLHKLDLRGSVKLAIIVTNPMR